MKFLVALRVAPIPRIPEDDFSAAVPKWNPFPAFGSPGSAIFATFRESEAKQK